MSLPYGFVKTKVLSEPNLTHLRRAHEIQYHLHVKLAVEGGNWDVAINVGTNDDGDLLKYKLVYDFRHPIISTLGAASPGRTDLDARTIPALDFLRSDILENTGNWRSSDPIDGSDVPEPVASLKRLLERARAEQRDTYIFGRFFDTNNGIHDTHMNQGSTKGFINNPEDRENEQKDHNDIWQDGAVLIDVGEPEWAAYFAAFSQQLTPTDNLGNPKPRAKPIGDGN